jgi:hypothetical protein
MRAEIQKSMYKKAKALAEAQDVLNQSQIDLRAILRNATSEHLPSIRAQAQKVVKLDSQLREMVNEAPELFPEGAKTQIVHEIEFGFVKERDFISIDAEDDVIAAIKANMPKALHAQLITTKQAVSKTAINKLSAEDLEKIGLEKTPGGDVVVVRSASSQIDKLVKLLVPDSA